MSSATVHLSNEYHPSTQILSLNRFLMRSHLHFITLTKNHSQLTTKAEIKQSPFSQKNPYLGVFAQFDQWMPLHEREETHKFHYSTGWFISFIYFYLFAFMVLRAKLSSTHPGLDNLTKPHTTRTKDDSRWWFMIWPLRWNGRQTGHQCHKYIVAQLKG